MASLSVLVLALLAGSAAAGGVVQVPLKRLSLVPHLRRPRAEEEPRTSRLGSFAQVGSIRESVILKNYANLAYYADIQVGTPAQTVTVIIDTGSSDLWVVSVPTESDVDTYFEASNSSTYEKTTEAFTLSYGSGDVKGLLCQDTVAIGELSLNNFAFGEVDNASGLDFWRDVPFNGILGLGFPALTKFSGPTLMQALVESGQLESPIFGFYLATDGPGHLVLGGYEPKHIASDFHWVSVALQAWWTVKLDSIKLGEELTLAASGKAVVDSGTTRIVGPRREVAALMAMLGAVYSASLKVYSISCDAAVPDVSFVLGGKAFALSLKDLVRWRQGNLCFLCIGHGDYAFWILGEWFMRRYYVLFDAGLKRVGIALAATPVDLV